MAAYDSEYYTGNWYPRNKDNLLKRRRDKYKLDPDHREAQRQRAKEYARRKRKGQKAIPRKRKSSIMASVRSRSGNKIMVEVFPISFLASAVGKPVDSVYYWEKSGYLPSTPIRVAGRRYYTKAMALSVKMALKNRGGVPSRELNGRTFRDDVVSAWNVALSNYRLKVK